MQDLLGRSSIRNKDSKADLVSLDSEPEESAMQEGFDIEGISAEELQCWSQLAPNDQKLALAAGSPAKRPTTSHSTPCKSTY